MKDDPSTLYGVGFDAKNAPSLRELEAAGVSEVERLNFGIRRLNAQITDCYKIITELKTIKGSVQARRDSLLSREGRGPLSVRWEGGNDGN